MTAPLRTITSVLFGEDGEELERTSVQVQDLRPELEYRSPAGELYSSLALYVSQAGHITHRCVGEAEAVLRASCPKAAEWNHTCVSYTVPGIQASMTASQKAQAEVAATTALFGLVEQMRVHGCPVHDPAEATPAVTDQLIAGLTPERIGQILAGLGGGSAASAG